MKEYEISVKVEGKMKVCARDEDEARSEAESFLKPWNEAAMWHEGERIDPLGKANPRPMVAITIETLGLKAVIGDVEERHS